MQITIIIPALNEARRIGSLLDFLLPYGHEVLVVNAPGTTDNTAQIATEKGAKVLSATENSRAVQMNTGARNASGDILYFVHADTIPPKGFDTEIIQAIKDGFELGAFSYQFDGGPTLLKANAFFTKQKHGLIGGGDQTLFILKETFWKMNGFCEKHCIMEDFEFFKRVRKQKLAYKLIDKNATVSARKYDNNSYLKVNLVNLMMVLLFKAGVAPTRLRTIYRKALR